MPPPKLPKLAIFTGKGQDLKPDKLNVYLRTGKKYRATSEPNHDSPALVDYYGAYTEGKANKAYQMLDRGVEDLSLAQLTQRLHPLFKASTNTDHKYHKWQNVRHTAGAQPASKTKIA